MQIDLVDTDKVNYVVKILKEALNAGMLERVKFQSQQMLQRHNFHLNTLNGRGFSGCRNAFEGRLVDQH